ncbi:hypothetical protein AR546_18985 [Leptospira interrogans serovar Canicola]|nr:hypothetical protein AR546_18985 [Leptospira interrogans serovar Canicola]POR18153.1 hypothetical protein B0T34_11395 [Leptospira interrogans serovar Canicola]
MCFLCSKPFLYIIFKFFYILKLKICGSSHILQNFTVKLQLEGITIVFCRKIKLYKNGFSESEH